MSSWIQISLLQTLGTTGVLGRSLSPTGASAPGLQGLSCSLWFLHCLEQPRARSRAQLVGLHVRNAGKSCRTRPRAAGWTPPPTWGCSQGNPPVSPASSDSALSQGETEASGRTQTCVSPLPLALLRSQIQKEEQRSGREEVILPLSHAPVVRPHTGLLTQLPCGLSPSGQVTPALPPRACFFERFPCVTDVRMRSLIF